LHSATQESKLNPMQAGAFRGRVVLNATPTAARRFQNVVRTDFTRKVCNSSSRAGKHGRSYLGKADSRIRRDDG
jgi:hypothetical protein